MTPEEIIDGVIGREILPGDAGNWSDDPADHGRLTVWGLSYRDLTELFGHPPTKAEALALPRARAHAFLMDKYYRPFDWIVAPRLQVLAVDTAVLHGVAASIRMLQRASGAVADGCIGPETRGKVNTMAATTAIKEMVRLRHLKEIRIALAEVPANIRESTDLKFLAGWWERSFAVGVEVL